MSLGYVRDVEMSTTLHLKSFINKFKTHTRAYRHKCSKDDNQVSKIRTHMWLAPIFKLYTNVLVTWHLHEHLAYATHSIQFKIQNKVCKSRNNRVRLQMLAQLTQN